MNPEIIIIVSLTCDLFLRRHRERHSRKRQLHTVRSERRHKLSEWPRRILETAKTHHIVVPLTSSFVL